MENIVKNMSFDIAAKSIFEDNGNQPLNSAELWKIMSLKGLVTTKGKTPVATLNSILLSGSINSTLATKSKRILFELVEGNKPQKFRLISNSSVTTSPVNEIVLEEVVVSGEVWKQGCNWGRGLPSFYEMVKIKEIAICYVDKIYAPGDLVLITEGFNVLSVVKVLETPISVTTLPEYETEFKKFKIEWSSNVHICKVQWYELNQPFEFKLIKGICKVNDPEVIDRVINLWNEKFNPSDANSLSFVQAAIRVLKEVDNKPMTSAQIWQYIIDNNIPLKSKGKTPELSLNALLQRSSENSKFAYKVNKPLFRVLEDKNPAQFVLRRHIPNYVRESFLEEGFLTKENLKSILSEPYYKDVLKEIVKEILQEK
jgi:hypothetical protein